MKTIAHKIFFKLLRVIRISYTTKIKAGPLRGSYWHVKIPDSRYLLGIYEPEMADIIVKAVRDGKQFVDIGANAGYFSLLAHKYCHDNKTPISVEPMPENIKLLELHFKLNNIQNHTIEALAISDRSGSIQFSNAPNLAANTYKQESSMHQYDSIDVPTNTLSFIAEKYKLAENCLVKIDVEGAELDVLKGGADFITTYKPSILLATHNCHVPNVKEDCLAFLQKIGYQTTPIADVKIPGQADFFCTCQG
jgi:FkbM family methyltransferase